MLIQESFVDVPTKADGDGSMRMFIYKYIYITTDSGQLRNRHLCIPSYDPGIPESTIPGCCNIQRDLPGYVQTHSARRIILTSAVTGPVARFARQIAGQGYICAAPSSYHEFTGPEPLEYNAEDTEHGNEWKVAKKLGAYDEDAALAVDYLLGLETCNGRVGATGMCLGGHLAYRCALDRRVKAAVCYFATDIHSRSLGAGKQDDSLLRAGDIKGELLMVYTPLVRCFCPEN